MTITQHTKDWYIAVGKVNGITVCGYGTTHIKALSDALKNIK